MVVLAKVVGAPIFVRGKVGAITNQVRIRAVNEEGSKINVVAVDVFTDESVYGTNVDVTSSDFETTVSIDLSELDRDTVVAIMFHLVDSSGRVRYVFTIPVLAVGSYVGEEPGHVVDIWYVAPNGLIVYTRSMHVVLPDNDGITTVVYDPTIPAIMWYRGRSFVGMVRGRSAIVEIRMRVPRTVAGAYVHYIDDPEVQDALFKVPELAPVLGSIAAVKVASMGYPIRLVGVSASYDDQYVYLRARAYIDLASPVSIWAILKIVAGAVLVGIGAAVIVGSLGAGTVAGISLVTIGGALVGSGIQEFVDELSDRYSESIVRSAEEVARRSRSEMIVTINNLKQYLDTLVRQGKLTREEASKIMEYVQGVYSEASEAMDRLVKMVRNAYSAGYSKGVEDSRKWIIVSGVVGFVAGYIFGSERARTYVVTAARRTAQALRSGVA